MITPFLYLTGLLLASAYPLGIEPLAFAERSVAPWALLALLPLYGGICQAVLLRRPRRLDRAILLLQVLALVAFAQLVFVFHLPLWIWRLGVREESPISWMLALVPLMLLYGVLSRALMKQGLQSGGLKVALRDFGVLGLAPVLLLLGLNEVFERVGLLRRLIYVYPAASWLLVLGILVLTLVFAPLVLRMVLSASPLTAGPLRDRLEHRCAAAGYRATDLLVVPSRVLRMTNAFVVGLSARWRYVFFTESIVAGMTPEELECVVLHEVTHNRKGHLLYFLLLSAVFAFMSGFANELMEMAGVPSLAIGGAILAWTALFWRLGFGHVSRHFETEADLVAARMAPAVEGSASRYGASRRMVEALQRGADLNGVPTWVPSWRQYSVDKRIDILLKAEAEPSTGERFEAGCDRIRRRVRLLLGVGLLCAGGILGLEIERSAETTAQMEAREAIRQGRRFLEQKRYEEARRELQRGIDAGADSGESWMWLADCDRALGRESGARQAETKAREHGVTDPRHRLRLRQE